MAWMIFPVMAINLMAEKANNVGRLNMARSGNHGLYIWMAATFVILSFVLFAPTYWLQIPARSFTGTPLLHLHGILFSVWPLFFLWQVLQAAKGQVERHRAWGLFGIALSTAMIFSGLATAIYSIVGATATGHGAAARSFAIVPISAMVLFGALVAVAIANVARPEIHKRLMLLATISIMQAPLDRIFFALNAGFAPGLRPGSVPPPPPEATLPSGLITLGLVLIPILHDWRSRGRVHPAYLIGGLILTALVFLRIPLGASETWDRIAPFLARFAG